MDSETRASVWLRAGNRCENCRRPHDAGGSRFHIEHIYAKKHGGSDELQNQLIARGVHSYAAISSWQSLAEISP